VRRAAALAALLAVTACSGPSAKAPKFNPLATGAATAPASPVAVPETGRSSVAVTGEIALRTTRDFQCSFAVDDFFVRGEMGTVGGVTVYLSLNVEFYKRPGRYAGRTQILVRRISVDQSFYASWYGLRATATVLPNGDGADIEVSALPPEAGTQSTRPVTISGHVACLGKATPGPG
jgi:hypothetical protein